MDLPPQLTFRPALPVVLNNVDYQLQEAQLKEMDRLLRVSGLEEECAQRHLLIWLGDRDEAKVSGKAMIKQLERARRALRCVILMSWLRFPYREMSVRLAQCPLFQWFCGLDRMDSIKVPSKSELQRFTQLVDAATLKELNAQLIAAAARPAGEVGEQALGLKNEIELKTIWMDSTALKAPIHFPVDWVLLRDATRTLMLAVDLIRRHGLKHRMAEPKSFQSRMNRLCMEMGSLRRKIDSEKGRKRVFRRMKKLMKTIQAHGQRHRDLLEEKWERTDWSAKQATRVIERIDNVLQQLPEAVKQAHARIIRKEQTANDEKILSFYEPDANVIVRGKPEAEIEFGNSLLLAEQREGLIVDWDLHQGTAPNDSRQLRPCVERIQEAHGAQCVEAVGADRQFDGPSVRAWLEESGIYNGVCPRSPKALENKRHAAKFQKIQRRRAQSEARIAILKNDFLGNPLQRRGFENRELQVGWSVLAHNLWLLARLKLAQDAEEPPEELREAA